MMLQEFNALAAKKDKGPVSAEEYDIIESVYMEANNFSKEDMVELYFNHPKFFVEFVRFVSILTSLNLNLKDMKDRLEKICTVRSTLDKALVQLNIANEIINKESKLN